MNTYYYNDESFQNSNLYKTFNEQNPTRGYLKIRAYAANQAIPIEGLNVVIRKIIDNNTIIFFEGDTDNSGVIERIILPTPKLNISDLTIPNTITYDIVTTYNDITRIYTINMYENIYVIQNISVIPDGGM